MRATAEDRCSKGPHDDVECDVVKRWTHVSLKGREFNMRPVRDGVTHS